MRNYNVKSNIEAYFLKKLSCQFLNEKVSVFVVAGFEMLGKFTALRFLEWLQLNPEGVIALPTGNTPKTFIEHAINYLNNWNAPEIQKELKSCGLAIENKPDLKSFYFVQLDEFFPINQDAKNSFAYFINKFYIHGFGFDKNKCLLMDVCYRNASLEEVNQFVKEYEGRIKEFGGIGFFLGGIGVDGHVAFNIAGSKHDSRTRVLKVNYPTAASLAKNFGGIDNTRDKKVITVGLQTITQNPTTTAIIIAHGQAKAEVVRNAVKNNPSELYPSTSFQKLKNSRFYITKETAFLLDENKQRSINIVDLKNKIKTDLSEFNNKKILHTSPHHDDIMLGYFPLIEQLVAETNCKHHFAIATSGYNSVKDDLLKQKSKLNKQEATELKSVLREKEEEEKMWASLGFSRNDITHLRLPFYKVKKINFNNDVVPVINLLKKFDPDYISICIDPEGMGPDTHFKVMQIMKSAVKSYSEINPDKKIKIIGYRNVWSRFYLWEANYFIPVSSEQLNSLKKTFNKFYKSQVKPMFPSVDYDEPFDAISLKIMKEQYKILQDFIGEDFFKNNKNEKLSKAFGFCFLKIM